VGTVQWVGSYVTGNQPPVSFPYATVYNFNTNNWRLAFDDTFEDVKDSSDDLDNELNRQESTWTFERGFSSFLSEEVINYNSEVGQLFSQNVHIPGTLEQYIVNPSSESNAVVVATYDRQIYVPSFFFKVNAEWLGIRTSVAKPDITGASCPAFNAQTGNGKATVSFRNTGDESTTFGVLLSGCEPFSQQFSIERSLAGGASADVEIPLDVGSFTGDTSKSCTIKVFNKAQSEYFDSTSTTCKVLETCVCEAGALRADFSARTVYKCSQDCQSEAVYLNCPNGITTNALGAFECVSGTTPTTCPDGTCSLDESLLGTCPADCDKDVDDECGYWVDLPGVKVPDYICVYAPGVGGLLGGLFAFGAALMAFIVVALAVNFFITTRLQKKVQIWGAVGSLLLAFLIALIVFIIL